MFGQLNTAWSEASAGADLAVPSDKEPTLAGVDTELGEIVDFNFLIRL